MKKKKSETYSRKIRFFFKGSSVLGKKPYSSYLEGALIKIEIIEHPLIKRQIHKVCLDEQVSNSGNGDLRPP